MMGDLIINGEDALLMGVRMGDGFVSELLTPFPLKDGIYNESRLENGRRLMLPKKEEDIEEGEIDYAIRYKKHRELNLTFTIEGVNSIVFMRNLQKFERILYGGVVQIQVPHIYRTYKLTYQQSNSFATNYGSTFCKMVVRFTEDLINDQRELEGSYNDSYNNSYSV